MKIILVTVIRNEADIVETFIRHHAEFVDELLIVDHLSCDQTPEILEELREEGLPLVLRASRDVAFDQRKIITGLTREAAGERGADWVLPVDADEFLTSPADPTVRPVLETLPRDSVLTVPWRTYVPDPADKPDEAHLHRRMTHRRADEGQVHRKVIVPGELVRGRTLTVGHGNHHVLAKRKFKLRRLPMRPAADLVLAHFPVRSEEQLTMRAVTAWPLRLARGASAEKHWGLHDQFRRIAAGGVIHHEDLPILAAEYAQRSEPEGQTKEFAILADPVVAPGPYELRRPWQAPAKPEVVFADVLERFAAELGRLSAAPFPGSLGKLLGKLRRRRGL